MPQTQTLAQKVRAKYPGAYDDLSDSQLEAMVVKKYPGVYDDLPKTPQAPLGATNVAAPQQTPSIGAQLLTGALEGGKGLIKSGLGTLQGANDLIRSIPVVGPALTGPEFRLPTEPSNSAQAIGKGLGDVAQFFIPGVGTGGRLLRGAKAAGLTMAQSGSPTSAGVSGTLAAALPGAGAAGRAAASLEEGAEKAMARALGPTKEATKSTAAKIVPDLVERGVKGSRRQMLAQAEAKTLEVGKAIKAEIDAAASRGESIAAAPIRQAIEDAAEGLATFDAQGVAQVIPGTETVVKRLAKLDRFVESLGDDIPIDKAAKVKRVWDQIVSKAGLYGQKVGASSTDSANAWATREAAGAFRQLLNSGNPTLEGLNKEFTFWKGVKDVLGQTALRTQGQSGGLTGVAMAGTGAVIGGSQGSSVSDRVQNAIIGSVAGKNLIKLLNSPSWLTRVSVPMRTMLADALASGNAARIESVAKLLLTAIPSQAAQ